MEVLENARSIDANEWLRKQREMNEFELVQADSEVHDDYQNRLHAQAERRGRRALITCARIFSPDVTSRRPTDDPNPVQR